MLFQCPSSLLLSLPVIQFLLSVRVFLPLLDLSPHSNNLIHSSHSFINSTFPFPSFPNFCLLSFIQKGFFMSSFSSVTLPSVLTHLHLFLIVALLLSFSVIFSLFLLKCPFALAPLSSSTLTPSSFCPLCTISHSVPPLLFSSGFRLLM